jgi:large subunit ribosomal protein L40e
MHLLIRTPDGKHLAVEMEQTSTVTDLKNKIATQEGIPAENQKLVSINRELVDEETLCTFEDGSFIDLDLGLLGGVGSSDIPDHLKELAYKYKVYKMICRGCYARLPPNAHNCRKRKCGHSANIRPKKKIKDKEKGK